MLLSLKNTKKQNITTKQATATAYNSSYLHRRWRCYQAIALNDKKIGPIFLVLLSSKLNYATRKCKQCINTKKVVAGLAHKKLRLRNWQIYLPQRQFYSPVKHPWWNIPAEIVTAKNINYFHRKTISQMFFWAINTPLYLIWLIYQKICFSTKKMVAGIVHKKYFLKTTHSKKQKQKKDRINKK